MLTDMALSVHVAVPGCHILIAGTTANINTYADTVAVSKPHVDSGILQARQICAPWKRILNLSGQAHSVLALHVQI